jgi:hypothetical protein
MIRYLVAALAATGACIAGASSSDRPIIPRIILEPASRGFHSQGPVTVKLVVENDSDASRFIDLSLTPISLAQGPDTVLAFTIIGPSGESVPPDKPAIPPGLRASPYACDFLEMPSGQFIGNRIDLTGPLFSYDFTKPGIYKVRARLTFTARAWLEKYAEAEGKSLSKEFRSLLAARSIFYDGSAESNEISIEVR